MQSLVASLIQIQAPKARLAPYNYKKTESGAGGNSRGPGYGSLASMTSKTILPMFH